MQQTKLISGIEVFCNYASGFLLSFVVWQTLAYLYGIDMPLHRNFVITTIFTIVSVARSYVWRRFFNAGLHRVVSDFVRNWFARREFRRVMAARAAAAHTCACGTLAPIGVRCPRCWRYER